MKKNYCFDWGQRVPILKKLLRIMKLTTFLLLFSVFSVLAGKSYSQTLSLKMENASLKAVLSKIEDVSGCNFLYSEKFIDVKRTVSINVENKKLEDVLNTLFAGTDVKFERNNRIIILSNEEAPYSMSTITQQQKPISGRVSDASGSPLPGVTVIIKGKTTGTITDANGNYSLAGVPADATLKFSFVGMKPQEISVAGKSVINVTLVEETTAIDEVVAIGYGTVKKKDLTGAVGIVKADQLDPTVNSNLGNALQGKIAGVSITSNGGSPGSSPTIQIRGAGTFNSTDPLILVDNIPMGLGNLNPNDIESVQVLKDASAAAIYGARAANGVLLITTKTGKNGPIKLEANVDYGVQQLGKKIDVCTSDQWVNIMTQMYKDKYGEAINPQTGNAQYIDNMPSLALHPEVTGNGINWQDLVYRTAPVKNITVGASGGTDHFNFNASLGYLSNG